MGQLAFTIGGAAIGSVFGMPQLGAMVGSMIGGALFAPTVKGPRMNDLTVTVSTYGNAIPELYGTSRMSGNVIWSSGIKEHKHKKRAGKGGPKQTTYTYTASFAVAFCAGEAKGITRIWGDTKLIYGDATTDMWQKYRQAVANGDKPLILANVLLPNGGKKGATNFRFYPGSEHQLPDALIVADKGAANAPAFRGLCYIVFEDLDLTDFGNRIPSITAEVTKIPGNFAPHVEPQYGGFIPDGATAWCDWEADRFFVVDTASHSLHFYSLSTMQPLNNITPGTNARTFFTFTPGGGPIYVLAGGASNGQPLAVIDSDDGSTTIYGRESNGLGDSAVGECQLFNPFTTPHIGAGIGLLFGFYTVDVLGKRTDYVAHFGVWGSYSIWTSKMEYVRLGSMPIPSNVYIGNGWPVRGKTDSDGSDIFLMYNDATLGLGFHQWSVKPGAKGVSYVGPCQTNPDLPQTFFYEAPDITEFDFVIGAIPVTSSTYTEIVTEVNATTKITTITTTVYHPNGTHEITIEERPQQPDDVDGTKTTSDTTSVTYKRFEMQFALHDPTDNSLNFCGHYITYDNQSFPGFLKWSVSEQTIKVARAWTSSADNDGYQICMPTVTMNQSRLQGGNIGWVYQLANPMGCTVDLKTGEMHSFEFDDPDTVASGLPWVTVPGGGLDGCWDDLTQSYFTSPMNRKATRYFFRSYGDGASLANIVADICRKTNVLTEADFDTSNLVNISVPGYVISDNSTAKDCLTQLSSAYFFDGVESDYQLKFVKRGGDSVATLTEEGLAPVEGSTSNSVKETTTQEPELPMRITVNYYSLERDYQGGSQFAKRLTNPVPTMFSPTLVKSALPIVLNATTAKQIADKALMTAWTNRTQVMTTLPWANILLDPSDVVQINMKDGLVYRLRIDKFDIGVDYSIQFSGVTERAATYVSTASGDSGSFPVNWVSGSSLATPLIINTPLLRDLDDTQGNGSIYYASFQGISGLTPKGVAIEQSKTGQDYSVVTVLSSAAETGVCRTILPAVIDGESTDETSTLVVHFDSVNITLETISQSDMLAGGNAALVGDEIIQFREATQNDAGRWTLRGFLRGRRGTQYAIRDHKASEQFVLLEAATVNKLLHTVDDYSATYSIKAVADGTIVEDATATVVHFEPNDLKPYSPEYLKANSTAGEVTVTFQRRSRITFGLRDSVSEAAYFEGQGPAAKMKWQVFYAADINDPTILDGTKTPDQQGEAMIYNPNGTFADLQAQFAFSVVTHAANPTFVVRVWEVGFVDGFPKIARFTAPIDPDGTAVDGEWAYAELY